MRNPIKSLWVKWKSEQFTKDLVDNMKTFGIDPNIYLEYKNDRKQYVKFTEALKHELEHKSIKELQAIVLLFSTNPEKESNTFITINSMIMPLIVTFCSAFILDKANNIWLQAFAIMIVVFYIAYSMLSVTIPNNERDKIERVVIEIAKRILQDK